MSAQLLIVRSYEQTIDAGKGDEKGITVTPQLLDGKAVELPVKGCINWEIHNTGTVICFLWDSMPLNPNDSYSFPNYSKDKILNSVPIRWDGTYTTQRTVATADNIQQLD
jgi:hypothetical protein